MFNAAPPRADPMVGMPFARTGRARTRPHVGAMLRAHRRWLAGARIGARRANDGAVPLAGAHLEGADLRRADLAGQSLREARLRGAALARARLQGADLRGADLTQANLADADLAGANLTGARLVEANLAGADLSRAVLWSADLTGAHVSGAALGGAELRHAVLLGITWGEGSLQERTAERPAGARLAGARLRGADLAGRDLRGADLTGADLRDADLRGADLRGACLFRARLSGADTAGARLEGADIEQGRTRATRRRSIALPAALTRERRARTRLVEGALIGVLALVAATVWLTVQGPGQDPSPAAQAAPVPPAAARDVAAPRLAVAPPGLVLTGLGATGSWIEARRGGPDGALLAQETIAPGATRRWSPSPPLWIRVGNTDGLAVSLDGRRRALPGGTGNFRISGAGVVRLSD
jgi:uncharacterized protein YjbI with pentapeptide repeats